MSKREAKLYLEDIINSIEKIEEYTKDFTLNKFSKDYKTIDAVVRNLTIIGEAANNMPEDIKLQRIDIPWNEIIGMRNKIIHEYFGVDADILWETVKKDLPYFKEQILEII